MSNAANSTDPLIRSAHALNIANHKELTHLLYPHIADLIDELIRNTPDGPGLSPGTLRDDLGKHPFGTTLADEGSGFSMTKLNKGVDVVKSLKGQMQDVDYERDLAEVMPAKQHFLIRFNTRHSSTDLHWRIFIDGEETLFRSFTINTSMYSETSLEDGVVKHNVACDGVLTLDEDGNAVIN